MTSPVSMPAGHAIVAADLDAYENATAAWVTWSPTLSSLTQGNGTLIAKYRQVGKTVDYRFRLILGTTSAVSGLDPAFTLPVAPHADYVDLSFGMVPIGHAFYLDFGNNTWTGPVLVFAGSTAVMKYSTEISGGWASGINTTIPHTWGTSDALSAFGTYEAA